MNNLSYGIDTKLANLLYDRFCFHLPGYIQDQIWTVPFENDESRMLEVYDQLWGQIRDPL